MNFCFDFLQELLMLLEAISNTRKSVSSVLPPSIVYAVLGASSLKDKDIQTLRSWFKKKLGCASLFQPTSQCLDI